VHGWPSWKNHCHRRSDGGSIELLRLDAVRPRDLNLRTVSEGSRARIRLMSFSVTWIRDGEDEQGMESFPTEQEAMDAARGVVGVAFVHRMPGGA
jgi:hypothetical protein